MPSLGDHDDIDAYVGSRISLRRSAMGLSQTALARELGVSFQQVQKYETGTNRISASRLHRVAMVLGTSVESFFPETDGRIDPGDGAMLRVDRYGRWTRPGAGFSPDRTGGGTQGRGADRRCSGARFGQRNRFSSVTGSCREAHPVALREAVVR